MAVLQVMDVLAAVKVCAEAVATWVEFSESYQLMSISANRKPAL
jgi:hypothetical protein